VKQVHQYDKILRENIEAVLPGLIRDLLGIDSVYSEELPDDVQHTRERKPDVLKKITNKNGETFVLHLELQVADEKEMVFRMAPRRCNSNTALLLFRQLIIGYF